VQLAYASGYRDVQYIIDIIRMKICDLSSFSESSLFDYIDRKFLNHFYYIIMQFILRSFAVYGVRESALHNRHKGDTTDGAVFNTDKQNRRTYKRILQVFIEHFKQRSHGIPLVSA